jgi:hypothetical protein
MITKYTTGRTIWCSTKGTIKLFKKHQIEIKEENKISDTGPFFNCSLSSFGSIGYGESLQVPHYSGTLHLRDSLA